MKALYRTIAISTFSLRRYYNQCAAFVPNCVPIARDPQTPPLPATTTNIGTFRHLSVSRAASKQESDSAATEHSSAGRTNAPGSTLGLGENFALTYIESGSKCLDLFFDSVPGIERGDLIELLEMAWAEDPSMTLKIIFQLGDPQKGKSDIENFYQSMLWLYENHFDTFLLNLKYVPKFTYYKALLDILQLGCEGPTALDDKREWNTSRFRHDETRKNTNRKQMEEFFQTLPPDLRKKWTVDNCKTSPSRDGDTPPREIGTFFYRKGFKGGNDMRPRWIDDEMRDSFVDFVHSKDKLKSIEARHLRKKKEELLKFQAASKKKENPNYCAFYDTVADIFAQDLIKEKTSLEDGAKSISGLPAKWAPRARGAHDRHTGIVDGIVQRLYPESKYKNPGGTQEDYLSFMRDRYRKEYTSPQRRAAEIPESFIGRGEWSLVNYKRMPSLCRYMHGHIYEKHDPDRYCSYVEDAKSEFKKTGNQTRLAAGSLLPHQVTVRALEVADEEGDKIIADEANLQWLRIVQDTKKAGTLPPAIAVCDVSGSMEGTPMDVAIALSLLASDIAEGPWKNKIVTFSESPELVSVPEATAENLAERVQQVQGMNWGFNTNFQAVFELLLESSKFFNVEPKDMPQVIFCFSDMEFDFAAYGRDEGGEWETDVELIRKKYAAAGYPMPQLVFWNLRPSVSRPSSSFEPGVTMLSGFSAGILKSFLEFKLSDITPFAQMVESLKPYQCLVVAEVETNTEQVEMW